MFGHQHIGMQNPAKSPPLAAARHSAPVLPVGTTGSGRRQPSCGLPAASSAGQPLALWRGWGVGSRWHGVVAGGLPAGRRRREGSRRGFVFPILLDRREPARAELSAAIDLYRAMEMTYWLPRAEMVLAQTEGR
jgi:hypothetical protein